MPTARGSVVTHPDKMDAEKIEQTAVLSADFFVLTAGEKRRVIMLFTIKNSPIGALLYKARGGHPPAWLNDASWRPGETISV